MIREVIDGRQVEIETFDDWISPVDARSILRGRTYIVPDELTDVEVVMDVGANVGATSTYFASRFPDAEIHAFEPAEAAFRLLERNTAPYPTISRHRHGLLDRDDEVDLFHGAIGPGQASIHRHRPSVSEKSERIQIRSTVAWLDAQPFDRVDVLKVDTEGCEVPIFESMDSWLPDVRVIYLEFHSREDRECLEAHLRPTHTLVSARQIYETGELTFVRSDHSERLRPGFLREILAGEAS